MNSSTLIGLALIAYLFASAAYFLYLGTPREPVARVARRILGFGLAAQLVGILLRWRESYALGYGHAPMSNMYESMLLFAACIAGVHLLLERRHKSPAVGALMAPLAALVLAYTSISPSMSREIEPLFPALKSNWLTAHVVVCFIAYAAFAVSAAVSVAYLWKRRAGDRGLARAFPSANSLDEIGYQAVALGFPMLTLGIFFGAVWADVAWGTYWSWDPKETWSLVTWLVYATYLHARLIRGWSGPRAALLSLIGFGAVMFTYWGVAYLLPGLHSYAS
jgi:cytochrome c-type biogenesis protein CcsB